MEDYTGALLDRAVAGDIDSMTPSEIAALHVALEGRIAFNRRLGLSSVPSEVASEVGGLGFGDGTTIIMGLFLVGLLTGSWMLPGKWVGLIMFAAAMAVLRCLLQMLDRGLYGDGYEAAHERVKQRMAVLIEAHRRAQAGS